MAVRGWCKHVFVGALFLLQSLVTSAAVADSRPAPRRIDYAVERVVTDGVTRYRITLRFRGDRSGRSTLYVPSEWASAQHAERGVEGLSVLTPQARIEDTDDPGLKHVVHRPGASIVVRYFLKQIGTEEPSATHQTHFLPVIQPGYFEWIGWTAWVVPAANDEEVHAHVSFKGLPPDWAFASSFGLNPTAAVFDGAMGQFRSAVFLGGDFRLRSRAARGGPVITAVRGDWRFRDSDLADRVAMIVDGERAFWRDTSQHYYLVALLPMTAPPRWQSSGGTGLTQSFVTFVTTNTPLDGLNFLWAHEYFHTWNNQMLGELAEPQPLLYWFSEGFTDYYMNLLQLRSGLLTLQQYAKAYDEVIASLTTSPEHHLPNAEVGARFFTDGDTVGRLPYWRGMLLAAQWDASIRERSHGRQSLDDAMRLLHRQHARNGITKLDTHRIVDVMKSFGVPAPSADIELQIDQGELPRLAGDVLTECIRVGETIEALYDIGFDRRRSEQSGTLETLRIDGPAYKAGLREGQLLRSIANSGSAVRPVEVGVQDTPNGEIRLFHYLPAGALLTRQTATLAEGLTDDQKARCLQTLGASASRPVTSPLSSVPSS